ncbi:unnamed protein product [Pipistrellus nathusii]|uniref:Uncharacterized protein n=1 Tax=Pipistrellus nathusii TaxID=59473 RepID=A0ABN9ZWI1_PIPNA
MSEDHGKRCWRAKPKVHEVKAYLRNWGLFLGQGLTSGFANAGQPKICLKLLFSLCQPTLAPHRHPQLAGGAGGWSHPGPQPGVQCIPTIHISLLSRLPPMKDAAWRGKFVVLLKLDCREVHMG